MKEMRSDLIVSSIEGPEGRVFIPAPKIPRSFPIRVGSEQGFEYEICSESPEIDPQSILLGCRTTFGYPGTSHIAELVYRETPIYRFESPGHWGDMGTILLVDDNPLRAAMRKSLLEGKAPEVVRARDASEALCMVESPEFSQGLALVITGHVMSGISGPEFVEEFRSRMPEVPVLVLTTVLDAEQEYKGISQVFVSRTIGGEELRSLVSRLVGVAQRQTA